jgi:Tol biopolymer transport system component
MHPLRTVLTLTVAALLVPVPAHADPVTIQRVNVSPTGAEANGVTGQPAVSADGRYVAFVSEASNLLPGGYRYGTDVYLRDVAARTTVRVSTAPSGGPADGASTAPAVSADGRYVAFLSRATNLVRGDTNARIDVFVWDRAGRTTSRVSVSGRGAQGDGDASRSGRPALSADGRYVAFGSGAANLVPGDTNGAPDVFVRDRTAGTTTRVSVATGGTQGSGAAASPAISADGRFVAFAGLFPGDRFGAVYLRDRRDGTTARISAAGANGDSRTPALSADGRYAAYVSDAANLVPGDTNGVPDVFVRDRTAGTTGRVSVAGSGGQADEQSYTPALSSDGRYVVFASDATTLVPGDTNHVGDVFAHDRRTHATRRVSVSAAGAQTGPGGYSSEPVISGDGRYVAFTSYAAELVPGDGNDTADVFLRTR